MSSFKALTAGLIAASLGVPGCARLFGSAPSAQLELDMQPIPSESFNRPVTLVSLGAGDNLGRRIYVFDLYLASLEHTGSEPSADLWAWTALAAEPVILSSVTDDVALFSTP